MVARPKDQTAKKTRRASGDGGLFYSPSAGLWTAKVELPPDPETGARRPKVIRRKLKEDARDELDEVQARIRAGIDVSKDPTVESWMWHWYENVDDSRPTTRALSRSKIVQYIVPVLGTVKLSELRPYHLGELHAFVRGKGLSPTTARAAHAITQSALASAVANRLILSNPAQQAKKPKQKRVVQSSLDVEQSRRLLRAVAPDRLAARYAMALLTGARQGEVLGLELDRINWATGEIDLAWQLQRLLWSHGCRQFQRDPIRCGKTRGVNCPDRFLDMREHHEYRHISGGLWWGRPKSAAGERTIPLEEPLRTVLALRVDAAAGEPNPHGLVFTAPGKRVRNTTRIAPLDGRPIDPSNDNAAWHAALALAGLPPVKLHSARHSTVSVLNAIGVPESVIIQIVGHSSVIQARAYDRRDAGPARAALAQVGGLFDLGELVPSRTVPVLSGSSSHDLGDRS